MIFTSAIAFAFIPAYSCSPNFSQNDPLPSCSDVSDDVSCCTRSSNMGWRYIVFVLGGVALPTFILRVCVFNLRETPKFLLSKNRDHEAVEVLRYIGHFNKRPCSLSSETMQSLDQSQVTVEGAIGISVGRSAAVSALRRSCHDSLCRFRLLFDGLQMMRLTTLVWLTYIMNFWSLTVAGRYTSRNWALC